MLASPTVTSPIRRLPSKLLVVEGTLIILFSGIWFYLWRYPIWSIDDLYFVTREGTTWGSITLGGLWSDLVFDVGERNGRIADLVLQLIFASTTALWLVFPLICLAFSLAVYASIQWALPREWRWLPLPQFFAFCTGLGSLFIISTFAPSNPGLTIMFMAATVGYLGGFVLLVAVFFYSRKVYQTERLSTSLAFLVLAFFASWHHEMIAAMVVLYLIGRILIGTGASRRSHLVTGIALFFAISRFAAPGMWARKSATIPRFPSDSLFVTTASDWMFDLQGYMENRFELWLLALVVLIVFTGTISIRLHRVSKAFVAVALANALSVLILAFSLLRLTSARAGAPESDYALVFQSSTSMIGFLACIVHLVCMVALFLFLRNTDFVEPLLPLACAYAGLTLAVFSRTAWDRPLFIPITLLLVFTASALVFIFQSSESRLPSPNYYRYATWVFAAAVLLYVAFSSLGPTKAFLLRVNENTDVQGKIIHNIERIRTGDDSVLFLPENYPHPQYFEWYQPRKSVQEQYLQYYDLDPSTPVVIVPADRIP